MDYHSGFRKSHIVCERNSFIEFSLFVGLSDGAIICWTDNCKNVAASAIFNYVITQNHGAVISVNGSGTAVDLNKLLVQNCALAKSNRFGSFCDVNNPKSETENFINETSVLLSEPEIKETHDFVIGITTSNIKIKSINLSSCHINNNVKLDQRICIWQRCLLYLA